MISGDHNLAREGTSARERFLLQKSAVEALELVLWPSQFFRPFFLKGKFDVVTSQDPFWRGLVAWVAAKRLHAKLNVQVHADLAAQSPVKHVLAQIVLKHADSVRVVSQKIREQVMRISDVPVSILPVYIDFARFTGLQKERHPKFIKTILWVGRFAAEKNPEAAITVLGELRSRGVDAGLVMLGEGPLQNALEKLVRDRDVAKYVEFPGWQDPVKYLKYADVVLCTSQAESFGASIVEALAAGIPVISYDVGVAREAGAIIAAKDTLADKTREALETGSTAELKFPILRKEEWAEKWKQSLQ
jgi:glycosyltransferase involved in cell wall biosynthesis